jgi:hypothetical protein
MSTTRTSYESSEHIVTILFEAGKWSWAVEGVAVNGGWTQLTGGMSHSEQDAREEANAYIAERVEVAA